LSLSLTSRANPYPIPLNPGFLAARYARQKEMKRPTQTKEDG